MKQQCDFHEGRKWRGRTVIEISNYKGFSSSNRVIELAKKTNRSNFIFKINDFKNLIGVSVPTVWRFIKLIYKNKNLFKYI